MLNPSNFYRVLREVGETPVQELVSQSLAEGYSAPEILNGGLIAGMAIIGQEFKARDLWVPDVLLAARNMQKGIETLKPFFAQGPAQSKGKIILGTVKGDIHDIGKNLVAMMMVGSGFEVIDLGIDVPTERFVASVQEHRPEILGLSALLTTTMLEMQKVIAGIKESSLDPKPFIIIGGAPVTEVFAREIEADGYGKDAVAAVELVNTLLAKGRSI
jgi:5-methyltetrahydrofolate--homocysteine methyltransferase